MSEEEKEEKEERVKRYLVRKTAACEPCRKRKQRCEGGPPCKYCKIRGYVCEFTEQHKRGRKTAEDKEDALYEGDSLKGASKENSLLSSVEVKKYIEVFLRFELYSRVFEKRRLLDPKTAELELQGYATAAFGAHYCGENVIARNCMNKARLLSASFFDTPSIGTVKAFVLMSVCWKKSMEYQLCSYYAALAYHMVNMVPSPMFQVAAYCTQAFCLNDTSISDAERSRILAAKAEDLKEQTQLENKPDKILYHTLRNFAKMLRYIGSLLYPTDITTIILPFDHLHISDDVRDEFLEDLAPLEQASPLASVPLGSHAQNNNVFISRTVHTLIEWKNGRLEEAEKQAQLCLEYCRVSVTRHICGVTDFSHICLFGVALQFFCSRGNFLDAQELCYHLKYISSMMGSQHKFIMELIDQDFQKLKEKFMAEKQRLYNHRDLASAMPSISLPSSCPPSPSLPPVCLSSSLPQSSSFPPICPPSSLPSSTSSLPQSCPPSLLPSSTSSLPQSSPSPSSLHSSCPPPSSLHSPFPLSSLHPTPSLQHAPSPPSYPSSLLPYNHPSSYLSSLSSYPSHSSFNPPHSSLPSHTAQYSIPPSYILHPPHTTHTPYPPLPSSSTLPSHSLPSSPFLPSHAPPPSSHPSIQFNQTYQATLLSDTPLQFHIFNPNTTYNNGNIKNNANNIYHQNLHNITQQTHTNNFVNFSRPDPSQRAPSDALYSDLFEEEICLSPQ